MHYFRLSVVKGSQLHSLLGNSRLLRSLHGLILARTIAMCRNVLPQANSICRCSRKFVLKTNTGKLGTKRNGCRASLIGPTLLCRMCYDVVPSSASSPLQRLLFFVPLCVIHTIIIVTSRRRRKWLQWLLFRAHWLLSPSRPIHFWGSASPPTSPPLFP